MKAIVLEKVGSVENLILKDINQPEIKEDEVLVEVKAISINPADVKVKMIQEAIDTLFKGEDTVILGWDISGIVSKVGKNVTSFKEGDKVFGMVNFPGSGKAYAQFVASPENHLAKMPENSSFEEAAATTLSALTALQVLRPRVKENDRVLIHAGSGGVGHFAIQIAKELGAYVVTTSSAKNRDFVISLGADEHIDYRAQAFEDVVKDIDFVLDVMGGEVLDNSLKVMKNGGSIISLLQSDFSEEIQVEAKIKNVNVGTILVESNGEDMNTLKDLVEEGALKATVAKTFEFEKMREAHTEVEQGRTVGKVIVTL